MLFTFIFVCFILILNEGFEGVEPINEKIKNEQFQLSILENIERILFQNLIHILHYYFLWFKNYTARGDFPKLKFQCSLFHVYILEKMYTFVFFF